MEEYECNIACITETKITSHTPNIPGYSWETNNRRNKQGGGVAIVISDTIKNKTNRIVDIEDQDQEIIWIEIKQGNNKTYIGTYYGPQENVPSEIVEREMSQIRTQIHKLKTQGRVILTGDFNAKINITQENCNQQTSRNGKHLEKLITDTEMIPITLKTARGIWTRQNRQKPEEKSVIDYILTDTDTHKQVEETIVDEEGTHRIRGTNDSDHNTILTTINIDITHKP